MLPADQVVQEWNDLAALPLVSSAPRSVPLACFVQSPIADAFGRLPALSVGVSGSKTIQYVCEIDRYSSLIDKHIAKVYPMRSTTRGLEEAIGKNVNQTVAQIAEQLKNNVAGKVLQAKKDASEAVQKIAQIFTDYQFWDQGQYSDLLVDHVCVLIFKVITLGKLCPTKMALADDFSVLHKLMRSQGGYDGDMELRFWMNSPNAVRLELLKLLQGIDADHTLKLWSVFWKRIDQMLKDQAFIYADMETAAIVTLLFMLDFYTQQQQIEEKDPKKKKKLKKLESGVWGLVVSLRMKYPALLLCFEFGVDFDQLVTVVPGLQQQWGEKQRTKFDLLETMTDLRICFNDLSGQYGKLVASSNPSREQIAKMVSGLPVVCRKMCTAIHMLRRLIIDKHDNTRRPVVQGDEQNVISQFELAMRHGLEDSEKEYIMQILAIIRSLRELISLNLPRINELIGAHIEQEVQDFVQNKLEACLIRSKAIAPVIEPEVKKIRSIMGYFRKDSDLEPRAMKTSELTPFPRTAWTAPPHISLVELLRTQLQIITNPESPVMVKKLMSTSFNKKDEAEFKKFIDQSQFYVDLLTLDETLSRVCDQSSLFFKEFFLDMYRNQIKKSVYFPVTASLPYILIDYAIQHAKQQELIGALWYPLSIYDDAAATALKYLDSQYLYQEIKTESEICLMTITKMISEFVFEAVRHFMSQRFIDQYNPKLLSEPKPGQYASSSALRIATVLQQNQLFLLGKQADVKGMFVTRLNELFTQNIEEQFATVRRHGILGIIMFSKMLELLRRMHTIFAENGLCLANFDDLVAAVTKTATPNSFRSLILDHCVHNLKKKVIPRYFLHTNPYRLVPPIGGKDLAELAKMKKSYIPLTLKQTTVFISVEHFREFCNLVDDGAMFIMCSEIKDELASLFATFLELYKEIKDSVTRIRDVPIGTGCHKAYDVFEGAYRSFVAEKSIDRLFDVMKAIGNAIVISEMLDIAFALKRSGGQQILSYLFMVRKGEVDTRDETVFRQFDEIFQKSKQYFEKADVVPDAREIAPPFLQSVISEVAKLVHSKRDLFDETSRNILDFPTLTGFAAAWSVLEFIFCLKEVHRKEESVTAPDGNHRMNSGSFAMFGEGVLVCAATLLCVTRQQPLSKVLSIGNRIIQQKLTDLAVLEEETLEKFLTCYQLVRASMDSSLATLAPAVKNVFGA